MNLLFVVSVGLLSSIGYGHFNGGPGMKLCRSVGDPHQWTSDHRRFDFQGQCSYKYVTGCEDDSSKVPFEIVGRHWQCGGSRVTCMYSVFIELYDENGDDAVTIELERHHGIARHYKTSKKLPNVAIVPNRSKYFYGCHTQKNAWYRAFRWGSAVVLHIRTFMAKTGADNPDVTIYYNGGSDMQIYTHYETWKSKVCGLCGIMDNNQANDFNIIDTNTGKQTPNQDWRKWAGEWLSLDYPPVSPHCKSEIASRKSKELKKCDGKTLCKNAWQQCIDNKECTAKQIEDSGVLDYCAFDGCEICYEVNNPFNDPNNARAQQCAEQTVNCQECNADDKIPGKDYTCQDLSRALDLNECSYLSQNEDAFEVVFAKRGPLKNPSTIGVTKLAEVDVYDIYKLTMDVVINKKFNGWRNIVFVGNHPSLASPGVFLHNINMGFHYWIRTNRLTHTQGMAGTIVGKKYSIEIVVASDSYKVLVNGQTQVYEVAQAGHPVTFNGKTPIYLRSPWYHGADVTITNLKYYKARRCYACDICYRQVPLNRNKGQRRLGVLDDAENIVESDSKSKITRRIIEAKQGQVVATLNVLDRYRLSFDLEVSCFPVNKWESVLQFGNNAHECNPCIRMVNPSYGLLVRQSFQHPHVAHQHRKVFAHNLRFPQVNKKNQVYHIEIFITQNEYRVEIDDKVVYYNSHWPRHHKLKNRNLYIGSPSYPAAGVQITNLKIECDHRIGGNDVNDVTYSGVEVFPNEFEIDWDGSFKEDDFDDNELPKEYYNNNNDELPDDDYYNNDIPQDEDYKNIENKNEYYTYYLIAAFVVIVFINVIITCKICIDRKVGNKNIKYQLTAHDSSAASALE